MVARSIFILTGILTFTAGISAQPISIVWEKPTEMPHAFSYHTVQSDGTCIYLNGASDGQTFVSFCPETHEWHILPSSGEPRFFPASAFYNNTFFLLGGISQGDMTYLASCRAFDLTTRQWQQLPSLPSTRCRMSAAVIGHRIFVSGGLTGKSDSQTTNTSELNIYDLNAQAWSRGRSMHTARHGHASVEAMGKLYVIGGYHDGGALASMEIYNPTTDTWTIGPDLPTGRGFLEAVVYQQKYIITAGGRMQDEVMPIEVYDIENQSWHQLPSAASSRQRFGMCLMGNQMYLLGGEENPRDLTIGNIQIR